MISKDSSNLNALRRINRRTFLKMAGVATGAIAFGGVAMRNVSGMIEPMTGCGIKEFQTLCHQSVYCWRERQPIH